MKGSFHLNLTIIYFSWPFLAGTSSRTPLGIHYSRKKADILDIIIIIIGKTALFEP
jgi:hypothetical protein